MDFPTTIYGNSEQCNDLRYCRPHCFLILPEQRPALGKGVWTVLNTFIFEYIFGKQRSELIVFIEY